ncbi:uncharacterized protein [Parasteatoda tepidariorum]|uniref:uncharacterized protein n=1 Tax=Parasteatoda tepidariorum TaxID=114398 RepID=UPI00077FA46B|nr:uncharacterized protein LOC107438957 [Parasteatoda tepidariorum]XP_015906868.1 uncharacterized protein LOC107438957 [Parasteatoda tepidariorum]XP_042896959.1 uncharacterized protein LOC107438957 [Parasteatoda tepidariorum]
MALGLYCKNLGIDEEVLNGQKTKVCEESKSISNGVMWELRKYKTAKKLGNKELVDWLINIFQVKCENTEAVQEELNKKYDTLMNIRKYLSKSPNRYRGEIDRLMNWNFDFPPDMGMDPVDAFEPTVCASLGPKLLKVLKEKGGDDDDSMDMSGHSDEDDEEAKKRKAREEIVHLKRDLGIAKKVITSLNDKMADLNKRCQMLNDLSKSSVAERRRIETDIAKVKVEWSNAMVNWHDCMERLNYVNNNKGNYLDVGYMVRRNKTKQGIFDELNYEFEKTLEDFKHKITKTNTFLDKEKKKKKVVAKQKSSSTKKRGRQDTEETEENKKPRLSEEADKSADASTISLDTSTASVADSSFVAPDAPAPQVSDSATNAVPASPAPNTVMTLEDFMNSEKLDEFKNGKFINALRAVYYELSNMPIPCPDVHEVIFSILDELEPLNTDKLPSPSFAGNILMECHMAAALQAFTEFLKVSKVSICNDGQTKFLFAGTSYDVTLADGSTLKLGVRDISGGSPDTSLSVLKDILSDIINIKVEGSSPTDSIIKTVKAFMSDHQLLDRKLIEILFLYKQQISPLVANNLETLPDAFRTKAIILNNFCTGLYCLLGLAKLADATVLAWEGMSSGNNVDAFDVGFILSKTVRQAYAFSDKVDPSSEDEIGKAFREFVLKEKKLESVPLAPHNGNIFNVIFHNSAGIWFYHEIGLLTEFFEKMKEKEVNVDSLSNLFNEKHSFAFARALGLIGKLVAVPLWTVLEDDIVEVGLRYNSLLKNIENWAKDSSKFMKGQERLFEDVPVSHDAVYASLVKDNEATDVLTKELLELLFTAFVSYIKFFMQGNKTSEKINGESAMEVDKDFKTQIHEDFASFDRITLNIHSSPTFALDALTLYSKTRNGAWQDKLCNKDNIKVFDCMEKDNTKQLKSLYKRKIKLSDLKGQSLDKNDTYKLIEKKYKLIDDLVKFGGLWKSEKEIDAQMREIKEVDKLKALQAQIRFRKYILSEEHDNGLLDLACEGKFFNSIKLRDNLKVIIKKEADLADVFELATATDDEQKRGQIIESCKNAQELVPKEDPGKTVPKENLSWLLGKLVCHLFLSEQGKEWITGVCIARRNLNGSCSYYIRYKSKGILSVPDSRIADDLRSQNLKVVDPAVNDLVGSRLSRAFIKDDGELEWLDCRAVGVTNRGSDFIVEFDMYGGDLQVDDVNIPELETLTFATQLLDEYRTGHLRLL